MQNYSGNSISFFSFFILILFIVYSLQKAEAQPSISFGPATYITDSDTTIFQINCGDFLDLQREGKLVFEVYASAHDIMDKLWLRADTLPEGATFPEVNGLFSIHSTFTWDPISPFSGAILFHFSPNSPSSCYLYFDETLPVELSEFISIIYGNNVALSWVTIIESHNSRFEIEKTKMIGGKVQGWITAGSVAGKGISTSPSNYTFTDKGLNEGIYRYRLRQIDYNGNFEYYYLNDEIQIKAPDKFKLSQNYPNPFNPSTNIDFELPYDGKVSILLYDISGREVGRLVNEVLTAGYHTVQFNGTNLASGMYFYRINATGGSQNFIATKKMVLIK